MDLSKKRKLLLDALKGRSGVYDLIGECDKAIKDIKYAIQHCQTATSSDSSLVLTLMLDRARLLVHRKSNYMRGSRIVNGVLREVKKEETPALYEYALFLKTLILHRTSKHDAAMKCCKELLVINENLKRGTTLIRATSITGKVYASKGDFDRALECFERSLKIAEEIDDKRGIESACNDIGILLKDKGDLRNALKYLLRYFKIAEKTGNKIGIGIVSSNMAAVYNLMGEHDKAVRYFNIDLTIAHETGDKRGVGIALNNMANAYAYKKEFRKALKYFREYLSLSEKIGYETGVGIACFNIGGIYTEIGKLSNAKKYFIRAEKVLDKIGDRLRLANLYINVSEMHEKQHEYGEAQKVAHKALVLAEELKAEFYIVHSLRMMGRAFSPKPAKSHFYLTKALSHAKKRGMKREIALLKSDLLELRGDT